LSKKRNKRITTARATIEASLAIALEQSIALQNGTNPGTQVDTTGGAAR
jgi:hypothetical protein